MPAQTVAQQLIIKDRIVGQPCKSERWKEAIPAVCEAKTQQDLPSAKVRCSVNNLKQGLHVPTPSKSYKTEESQRHNIQWPTTHGVSQWDTSDFFLHNSFFLKAFPFIAKCLLPLTLYTNAQSD